MDNKSTINEELLKTEISGYAKKVTFQDSYSGYMEVYEEDMFPVITALLKIGYQVLLEKDSVELEDGEKPVVMIHFINPEWTAREFVEVYCERH